VTPGRTHHITELVDLYPTLCDLAKVPKPDHLEGESLLQVLKQDDLSQKSAEKSVALSQYTRFRNRYMGRAIRTQNHRYVAWFDQHEDRIVARELYDHRVDPHENNNLASSNEHKTTVANFDKQVHRLFKLSTAEP
jgi:iduronate 2-sulfatase